MEANKKGHPAKTDSMVDFRLILEKLKNEEKNLETEYQDACADEDSLVCEIKQATAESCEVERDEAKELDDLANFRLEEKCFELEKCRKTYLFVQDDFYHIKSVHGSETYLDSFEKTMKKIADTYFGMANIYINEGVGSKIEEVLEAVQKIIRNGLGNEETLERVESNVDNVMTSTRPEWEMVVPLEYRRFLFKLLKDERAVAVKVLKIKLKELSDMKKP